MRKIFKILITVILIVAVFVVGYFLPFWRQKPIPPPIPIEDLKPLPYGMESHIENGVLYTSVKAIPIACITQITRVDSMSVMIEYKFSNTHMGALMMSYLEYKRLFEVNDVKT